MCKKTLQNVISMYYDNINNDEMLKIIAFRAVQESITSGLLNEIIELYNSNIFSEKFRGYLVKGICYSTNLCDPICSDILLKKEVDLDAIQLDRLKNVIKSFDEFKLNFNSKDFDDLVSPIREYVLNVSLEKEDYDYITGFIINNEDNHALRSKYLHKIKTVISKEDFNKLNFKINDDMYCEVKIPKSKTLQEEKKLKITRL